MISQCVCLSIGGTPWSLVSGPFWGYPSQTLAWGKDTSGQDLGVPQRQECCTLPQTGYAAGGMPLAVYHRTRTIFLFL